MNVKQFIDEKLEEWVLIISFILLTAIIFAQVIFRYVFSYSIGWSEELGRYILIWIAWISASYAVRRKQHIRIEMVKNKFSVKIQKWIEAVVLLLWFYFAMFLAIEGTKLVMNIQVTGQTSPSMGLPMWAVYIAIPLGGVLMSIRLVQQFYFLFKSDQ
ncbi:TRAP transporter small permease [Virgibacillus sp. C22-A2]|uniref:TRAP transporter small permease n=1 Tax=Virgibacillus tibetensis TaxID=3042313 RepID=A0ABU6KEF8_9BACI|nr:TRAP transporter small permease [Virgibacillus sp. C22-A2]